MALLRYKQWRQDTGSRRKFFMERYDSDPLVHGLSGALFDAMRVSRYHGRGGVLDIAQQMAVILQKNEENIEAFILLVFAYFEAGVASLAMWKKSTWKFLYLVHALRYLFQASTYADLTLRIHLETREGKLLLTKIFPLSDLEVLMSPDWMLARIFALNAKLCEKYKERSLFIGRQTLKYCSELADTILYHRIEGMVAQLTSDEAERSRLRFSVMGAVESGKVVPPCERARLHALLGEHEKARKLAMSANLPDVLLKVGAW